jgi:predicted ATPase
MYIKCIEIKNIRNINRLELDFSKPAGWHVLIGDNGAGKSSILRAISLAIIGPNEATALRQNLATYVSKDHKKSQIRLQLEPSEADGYKGNPRPRKKTFWAGVEILSLGENGRSSGKMRSLEGEKDYEYAQRSIWSDDCRGWFSTAFGPFRRFTGGDKDWDKIYYSNPKAGAHLSVFGEDVALTESLEWLRELKYQDLEGDEVSKSILRNLKRFINEGQLLPHGTTVSEVSSAGVKLRDGNNQLIDIVEMSDGFRSILSLTFELLRQMIMVYGHQAVFRNIQQGDLRITLSGAVLIDEIDAHLHPTWQARIGQWFTNYFPNLQFIVTTHSPIICRAAEKGSIWRLAAPGSTYEHYEVKGTERQRLIYGNILEAYGTELFGVNTTSSDKTTVLLEELAGLNKKSVLGKLSKDEHKRRDELLSILPTKQNA